MLWKDLIDDDRPRKRQGGFGKMGSLEICWRKYYTSQLSYFNGGIPSFTQRKLGGWD